MQTVVHSGRSMSNNEHGHGKRRVNGAIIILVVILFVVSILAKPRPQQSLLLFLHVVFLTTGYLGCYAIGFLCIFHAGQLSAKRASISQWPGWRRNLRWMTIGSALMTFVGLVAGAFWANAAYGRYFTWQPKELAALVLSAWLLIFLTTLKRGSARLVLTGGAVTSILVTLAWFGSSFVALLVVLWFQLRGLFHISALGPCSEFADAFRGARP